MKKYFIALVTTLLIGTANAQFRVVEQTDSANNERVIIELKDTLQNGVQQTDTVAITRLPLNQVSDYDVYTKRQERRQRQRQEFEEDMKDVEQVLSVFGKTGAKGFVFIIFLSIIALFFAPLIIISIVLYSRHRNRKMKYELAAKALESGQPLPREIQEEVYKLKSTEEQGIKNMCTGMALFIFLWAFFGSFGFGCIGLLVAANGLSKFLIARRIKEKERDEELRSLKEALKEMQEKQDNAHEPKANTEQQSEIHTESEPETNF